MKSFLLCKIAVCALHPIRLEKHRRITPIFTFSRHFIFVDLNHFTKLVEFCFIFFWICCMCLSYTFVAFLPNADGWTRTNNCLSGFVIAVSTYGTKEKMFLILSAFFIIKCSTSWTTSAHLLLLVYIIFKGISELSVLQTNTTFSRR